jgi:hypothetical protein
MLIFDKLMRLDSKSGRTNFYAVLHSIFSAIFEVAQGSTISSHCHLMFQALINHMGYQVFRHNRVGLLIL